MKPMDMRSRWEALNFMNYSISDGENSLMVILWHRSLSPWAMMPVVERQWRSGRCGCLPRKKLFSTAEVRINVAFSIYMVIEFLFISSMEH